MATYTSTSGNYKTTLTVTETATSIPNNTSTLSWSLKVERIGGASQYGIHNANQCPWSVSINGSRVGSGTFSYDFRYTGSYNLGSGNNVTVAHNNDGTKTGVAVSGTVDLDNSAYVSVMTASGTIDLTTIPRASDISLSVGSYNVTSSSGNAFTYTITAKSTSFYNRLRYTLGSTNYTGSGSTGSRSGNFTNAELLTSLPTATSGSLTAYVDTATDSGFTNIIGTNSVSIPISINTSYIKPSLTLQNLSVNNSPISGYAVAGYSKVQCGTSSSKWSASGGYGSNAITVTFTTSHGSLAQSSYSASSNSISNYTVTNVLPSSSSNYTLTISATARDSRGATTSASKTYTVYGYTPPTANLTAYRVASSGSTAEDGAGTFAYVAFSGAVSSSVNSQNTLQSVSCSYSGSISGTIAGSTSATTSRWLSLTDTQTVTFTVTATDKVTSSTSVKTISTASYPLDLYDNGSGSVGVGFGAVANGGWLTSGLKNDLSRGNKTRVGIQTAYESTNSSSGTGFMIIATIKPKGAWDNKAITFKILRRGIIHPSNVSVRFDGANSTDPGLSSFVADFNSADFYLYKSATSTWQLISYKTNYDQISILALYADDYVLSLNDIDTTQSVISAVPDGAVQATEWSYLHAQFATNATNTMWTNNSNTTARNYYVPFGDGASTANRGLQVHSGLSFWGRVGTASADGYVLLKLGNGTNVGTAGNMWGELDIYPRTGNYYIGVQAPNTMTATRIIRFPDGGGTLEVKTALYALNILGGNEATVTGVKGTYQRLRLYAKAAGYVYTVWEVDVNQITTSANKFSHSVPQYISDPGDWYITIFDLKLTQSSNDVKVYFDVYNKRVGTSGQSTQNNNSNYAIYKIEGIV